MQVPRVESQFPLSPVGFLQFRPTGLQSPVLWGLLFLVPDTPGWEPTGFRTFTPVGEPLHCDSSPVRGSLKSVVWDLDDTMSPPLLLLIALLLMSSAVDLFWQVPVFCMDGCSADSCDFDAHERRCIQGLPSASWLTGTCFQSTIQMLPPATVHWGCQTSDGSNCPHPLG